MAARIGYQFHLRMVMSHYMAWSTTSINQEAYLVICKSNFLEENHLKYSRLVRDRT